MSVQNSKKELFQPYDPPSQCTGRSWQLLMAKGIPPTQGFQGIRDGIPTHQHTVCTGGSKAQKLTGPAPHWPGAQLTMKAGMFKPLLKQHALRFWCPHRVPFLPHTLHFHTGFSIGSSCGHGCYLSLLWGQHWARLPLQAVAASRLTLYPANLLHILGCNKQTNKQKTPGDLCEPAFCTTTIRTQVPPFLHFSTSLPLPLSPEHKSHIQGIMINVCNQIPTKQRLSTAILLICPDARGAHPYSPFITLGQLQNKTPTHTELLLHPCTQSPSRNFNFRSSQLSQHLPHPPRTTNAGFLHGPGLFMCRARKRIAFAEAMNDLSSR